MASKVELFITIILTMILRQVNTYCDMSTTTVVDEGNLGQASTFSWLGILRVILYDRDPRHPDIAVTGVVLIKKEFALINAHDVSRVPLARLQSNGRLMFLATTDTPWYCKPKAYTVHPEYGPVTHNTIAILELDLSKSTDCQPVFINVMALTLSDAIQAIRQAVVVAFVSAHCICTDPMKPICWLSQPLNTSTFLYVAGYTDEHMLLEKVMYKIQYTDAESCSEFYDRAKLGDNSHKPVNYVCGFASSTKTHCIWDNGMVLITNASEFFSLVGFGIRGPGCAAPARFIHLQFYYEWMEEVTRPRNDDYEDYRRDGGLEEVPLHMLYEMNAKDDLREGVNKSGDLKHFVYPADVQSPRYFNLEDDSLDDSITVFPFNNSYESYDNACNSWRILMYREHFELNALGRVGSAVFKVSLFDLLIKRCSCIKIIMDTENYTSTILSVLEEIDLTEGEAITSSEEMFENIIKVHPIEELYTTVPPKSDKWQPGPNLQPAFIKEYYKSRKVTNYNLYIRFGIKDKAVMKIEMYGESFKSTEKVKNLRSKVEDESAELRKQMWIRRPTQAPKKYQDRLLKNPAPKPGRVKEFPGISSKVLLTKSKHKAKEKTNTMKTMTTTSNFRHLNPIYSAPIPFVGNRPSSSLYNLTRHVSYPVSPARKGTPPTFYTRPVNIANASYSESPRKKATLPPFDTRSNHVTHESYPISSTKMATPSLLYPRIIQVTRKRNNKYNKVRLQTQTFHLSTPYPSAFVESVNGAARSPRGSIVLTFVKYLCFNSLILLLHF